MKLEELKPAAGSTHRKKIIGRGIGLNHTNVFPYSSEVRNLESNVSKAVSFWSLQGRMCPCFFQLPEAARLPWLVAPSSSCDFFFFTVSGLNCGTKHLHCGPWAL